MSTDKITLGTLTATMQFENVSTETMRALVGGDWLGEGARKVETNTSRVMITARVCPVRAPRKRKGLTGKAYRIARRRYARTVRAWRRGLVPSNEIAYYLPAAIVEQAAPGRLTFKASR